MPMLFGKFQLTIVNTTNVWHCLLKQERFFFPIQSFLLENLKEGLCLQQKTHDQDIPDSNPVTVYMMDVIILHCTQYYSTDLK